jgi:hypothetical protein
MANRGRTRSGEFCIHPDGRLRLMRFHIAGHSDVVLDR